MACKSFWVCLLKVLNFLLIIVGLTMIGYGVFLFVEYKNDASTGSESPTASPTASPSMEFLQLARPFLLTVSVADSIFDNLPKAWFIYLFTGIGVILVLVACCGCIGTCARNRCCLTCYSVLIILLILVELGIAAFIFFDKNWEKEIIPADRTGNFDTIYQFLQQHWKIIRWVALGIVIFEAITFLLALVVRAANRPSDYDSDDEYIRWPRQQISQPLMNKQSAPAPGVPVTGAPDQRPSRNDAWSTRMREKYGFDTSEFTYDPSESKRHQQAATQPSEGRGRCIIM